MVRAGAGACWGRMDSMRGGYDGTGRFPSIPAMGTAIGGGCAMAATKVVRARMKGQMTIPEEVRREQGIEENSLLRVRAEEGELRIRPVEVRERGPGPPWLRELCEYFAPVREEILRKGYTDEEVNAAIDEAVARAFVDHGLDPADAKVSWSGSPLQRGAAVDVEVSYSVPVFQAPLLGRVAGPSIVVEARHVARIAPFRSRS